MKQDNRIKLGDKVRGKFSGYEGYVITISEHLEGYRTCDVVNVHLDREGNSQIMRGCYYSTLEVVKEG